MACDGGYSFLLKKKFFFFYPHTLTFCRNRLTDSEEECEGKCEGKLNEE